jgi:glycosyltransferase involved in cell wall biosynthesis
MGRAIITTDWIGCKETVSTDPQSRNGVVIPVKSASALVEAIENLINNPQEIVTLGKNGRAYAEQKFDVNKVNKQMLEILEA